MAIRCSECDSVLLLAEVKDATGRRFCNQHCADGFAIAWVRDNVSPDQIELRARELKEGGCPKCGSDGPVEVHRSYLVLSALLAYASETKEHVMCRSCARLRQVRDLSMTLLLGWWHWIGALKTPFFVGKNVQALFEKPDGPDPSDALRRHVSLIAYETLEETTPEVREDEGSVELW